MNTKLNDDSKNKSCIRKKYKEHVINIPLSLKVVLSFWLLAKKSCCNFCANRDICFEFPSRR